MVYIHGPPKRVLLICGNPQMLLSKVVFGGGLRVGTGEFRISGVSLLDAVCDSQLGKTGKCWTNYSGICIFQFPLVSMWLDASGRDPFKIGPAQPQMC